MTLPEEEIEKYHKAGEIARKVLENIFDTVKVGSKLIDICNNIENEIIRLGGKPAFPVNISINEVAAHYSSPIGDESIIPSNSIVKVDIGVHVDGYIVDTAVTLCFNEDYYNLVEASLKALQKVYSKLKAGLNIGKIGGIIEQVITNYGYKPVRNLTGHLISRYNLHAGKIVPNIMTQMNDMFRKGEVYAIEPFATNGDGFVVELSMGFIYRIVRLKKIKDKKLNSVVRYIINNFDNLPFSERWLTKILKKEEIKDVLQRLKRMRILHVYPILVERSGGMVSQFEDTFIIQERSAIPLVNVVDLIKR